MRDSKRIPKILKLIEKIWNKYPDLRLTQLILNAREFEGDPYYMEDGDLERNLKARYLKKAFDTTKPL